MIDDDTYRILRTAAVPVGILVVFLVMIPRTCARHRAPEAAATTTADTTSSPSAPPVGAGLQIANSPSQPAAASNNAYPDGLDAARVQYLVEINNDFASPYLATLPKKWDDTNEVTKTLASYKYIEKAADGTTNVTRDGLMSLTLLDSGDHWTFSIAKRVFDRVTYLSRVDDDKYDITIAWHYEVTPVGTSLGVKDTMRASIGHFVGAGREWSLANWVTSPAEVK